MKLPLHSRMPVIGSIITSLLAAIGGSCCLISLLFFNLGMGGAWIANLAALKLVRPYMLASSIIMLLLGIFTYWRKRRAACVACSEEPPSNIGFYVLLGAIVLIGIAIVWPWVDLKILRAVR